MKILDRICGWLLILGAGGHSMGSYNAYKDQPMTLLWALSASIAGVLLAALNLLRVGRPTDRTLAWVCVVGNLVWLVFVYAFGRLIGNLLDFRVVIQAGVTIALLILSLRTALRVSQTTSAA
jgi:hypothetical protein